MKSLLTFIFSLTLFFCVQAIGCTVFGQIECELLEEPTTSNNPYAQLHTFSRLRSTTSQFRSILSDVQRQQLKEMDRILSSIEREMTGGVPETDPEYNILHNQMLEMQEAIAPEMISKMEVILGDIWPTVVFKVNRLVASGYGYGTGLSAKTVSEGLKLTAAQKSQLFELEKQVESKLESLNKELNKQLKSVLEMHFAELKSKLDSSQQFQFLDWFGDLNLFDNLLTSDQYRARIQKIVTSKNFGVEVNSIQLTRLKHDDDISSLPRDRRDIEIDELLYMALTIREIEFRLMLSTEQKQQIESHLHGNDVRLKLINYRANRLDSILEDTWELPAWLDAILLKHQRHWLKQFEFQVYNMAYADSFGILNPPVAKKLKLTGEQSTIIDELAFDYRNKVGEIRRHSELAIATELSKVQGKMLGLLNYEQRHKYRLWFGPDSVDREPPKNVEQN
jgi:hypothetical protein